MNKHRVRVGRWEIACISVQPDHRRTHDVAAAVGDGQPVMVEKQGPPPFLDLIPPVLLLHTSFLSAQGYVPLLQRLEANFAVWALDLPGYGESSPVAPDDPLPDMAAVVAGFMDALGLRQAALVGVGRGAKIAAEVAARWPQRVSRLILSNPLCPPDFMDLATYDRAEDPYPELLSHVLHDHTHASRELMQMLAENRTKTGPYRQRLRAELPPVDEKAQFLRNLERIRCRTLLIWGRQDAVPLDPTAYQLKAVTRNARLAIIEQSRCWPFWEQPDAFAALVRAFLLE